MARTPPGPPVPDAHQPREERLLNDDTAWRALAECADTDPAIFYADGNDHANGVLQVARAKAICAACPVAQECLEEALVNGEAGVWGATTEKERAKIRRERAKTGQPVPRRPVPITHGTVTGYNRGCRLACCREANRVAKAARDWAS